MLKHEEMVKLLKSSISAHRYEHTMGVVKTASELAVVFGADEEKCRLAALLHDCAKGMTQDEMLAVIAKRNVELFEGEADAQAVLHAPAGAAAAEEYYGVEDKEVLSAIRKHTIGGNMNLLEAIIYVADFIEPGRKDFEGLSAVRELARKDIFAAAKECARLTNEYCIARGQKVFVPA